MTTLETLARHLATKPADEAALAAFVDCLKEADGSQAVEALRLLLPPSDVPPAPTPVQPAVQPLYLQRSFEVGQERLREIAQGQEAARRQRERDERILQCARLAIGITAAVIATTLSFLGF